MRQKRENRWALVRRSSGDRSGKGSDRRRHGRDRHRDEKVFVQIGPPLSSRSIGWSYLVLYLIFLGWLTLSPRPGAPGTAPDWIPYRSLDSVLANLWIVIRHPEYLKFIDLGALKHVFGNVLLFVPLGWVLPVLWEEAISAGRVLAVAASSSLTIELWQLSIRGRMSTIDDVILNTLGAGIGATILFGVEGSFARRAMPFQGPEERRPPQCPGRAKA